MIYLLSIVFIGLIIYTLLSAKTSGYYHNKSWQDWTLDLSNLFIQGTLIPFMQTYLIYEALRQLYPAIHRSLDIGFIGGFVLNFVLIDYLYYWNHRLFHKRSLLPIHIVHHSAKKMDVLVTSRNTLWSSFLIIYIWVNGFFVFILKDPIGFILAATLTAALDCWRHSVAFDKKWQPLISKKLGLITPKDHSWHHSKKLNFNFGANLNIFDRLHGTYLYCEDYPESLGVEVRLSLFKKLFFPFGART